MHREKSGNQKLTDGKLEMIASTFIEKEATSNALQGSTDRDVAQEREGGRAGKGEVAGARLSEKRGISSSLDDQDPIGADEPLKRIKIDQELAISKVQSWL
jgi:hypothetical protein